MTLVYFDYSVLSIHDQPLHVLTLVNNLISLFNSEALW